MVLGLEGKLSVVTGSTAGTAFALARANVIGRTDEWVQAAVKTVKALHPAAEVSGLAAGLKELGWRRAARLPPMPRCSRTTSGPSRTRPLTNSPTASGSASCR